MIGVPTVLSDITALREISGNGEYSMLFRTGDAHDLAGKLIALLEDPAKRVSLGHKAKAWANEQFGIESHIAALSRLYESLVA
jgi:glycosyltransferase involved in cell wall biosynthesis